MRTNGYINMMFPLLVHSREKAWERVGAGGGQGGRAEKTPTEPVRMA